MDKYKTLIILDWDDTLFPTSWIVRNKIDLADEKMRYKYMVYFSRLDALLYGVLTKLVKYGQVVIVTNAANRWVDLSANMVPNSKKVIDKQIIVMSAREVFQNKYPNEVHMWKKLVFKQLTDSYFIEHGLMNIVSVGDAEYEFNATTDLYDKHSVVKRKLLKTVRFIKDPTFDSLIDQLEVFDNCVHNILISVKHYDLKFKDK